MGNIKLRSVIGNENYDVYKNDYYEVVIDKESKNIIAVKRLVENMPQINIKYGVFTSNFKGIEIQTISYGSLPREELEIMVNNYNIAIATVEDIEENYI